MIAKPISGRRAKEILDKGGVLVDVRSPVAFRDGTLPNALNLPLRSIGLLRKYSTNTKIIFFGESDTDENLDLAIKYASQMGFTNLFSLGSIDNWNK